MNSIVAKNAVFIINPVSGTGDPKKRKEEIIEIAKELGWKGKIIETTRKKTAGNIAEEEIKKGARHLVVCGGDGTIMEVLPSIIKKDVVLGIVPLGTGNLFAENLDINGTMQNILEQALFGKVHKIDIGQANGKLFSVMAGIGFDAEVMRDTNRTSKSRYGFFAYLFNGLKRFGRSSGVYQITIDDKKTEIYKAKVIMIANMGRIQGGIHVVPETHSQNGELRIGIIQAPDIPAWINVLGNALMGDVNKSPHYTLLKGKRIEVTSLRRPKPFECDGNHFPPTKKLTVEIFPRAVSVLAN